MTTKFNLVLDENFDGIIAEDSLIIMIVPKSDVITCATGRMVDRLMKLSDNKENIFKAENALSIMFAGWDNDPRELCEIPEVRKYFFELNNQWSYWFHFCEKFTTTIGLVLSLLFPITRGILNGKSVIYLSDNDVNRVIMFSLFDSLNKLHNTHGIGIEKNKEVTNQVIERFKYYFKM